VLVALLTGAAWLAAVAASMSGTPLGGVLQGGVINIVLTQTHFGEAWLIRAGLLVALAVCLALQARSRNHAAGWVGLLAAAAFNAALAWAGHGAATEAVPFDALHLPADLLHLLASGAWLGALVPLLVLLAGSWRDTSLPVVTVARAATQRFSVLGLSCVGTLLVTGVINTWFLAGSVPALLGTLYGQLLLLKIALFAGMIAAAAVNQRRCLPPLANAASDSNLCLPIIAQLRRNVAFEVSLGVFVLAIVGIIGILPPGLHTEPRWPLPFRLDLSEGGFVKAYPTSFYASTQPYSAPSVARGAPLYVHNCAVCHGASGRGDGPLAGKLPVRPANLTEPHLFAHKVGEMFWWISYGSDNHVMPGFADKLTADQRWDVINFVLARTAGILTKEVGSQISATAAVPLPDFAFEQNGAQNTLSQALKTGPALVVLFASPIPQARLAQLAKSQPQLAAGGLRVVAVDLAASAKASAPIVDVSPDVRAALALFRTPSDGGETELMLDRGGNVRARWTASGSGGLAGAGTLLSDAATVAKIPVAAANHAGHAH
jgi:putative copper resistance protein D